MTYQDIIFTSRNQTRELTLFNLSLRDLERRLWREFWQAAR